MNGQKMQECFEPADLQHLLLMLPGQVVIIDVRKEDEYTEKHIPAAINIPLDELKMRAAELSGKAKILTVCSKGGGRSAQAADLLNQLGFNNVKSLCRGTAGWFELTATDV